MDAVILKEHREIFMIIATRYRARRLYMLLCSTDLEQHLREQKTHRAKVGMRVSVAPSSCNVG